MSGGAQDQRAMLRRAQRAGCKVDRSGRHVTVTTPNGTRITAASSPSDVNAARNLRRDLVRAGVAL